MNLKRQFINRYQGSFPLIEDPFTPVAAELGIDRDALIELIQGLLDEGLLSRFGPSTTPPAWAAASPWRRCRHHGKATTKVDQLVNAMPEVAHNYQREHSLNMWFVIATETPELLQQALDRIEQASGLPVYNFPKLQTFYLGLWLRLDEDGGVSTEPVAGPLKQGGMIIDELDRKIVQFTQAGLPTAGRRLTAKLQRPATVTRKP